jgi:hypothetical protein
MPRQRQTIIFFLPLEMEAFVGNSSPYSSTTFKDSAEPTGSELESMMLGLDLGDQNVAWDRRQLYMNPQSFNISEQKLVQKSLTKGGFVVQYWGEELTTIAIQGTTGSAGIDGINILRDIYRHEQLHYRTVLAKRQREVAVAAAEAYKEAEKQSYDADAGGALLGFSDALTGGAVSKSVKGLSNSVDILFGSSLGSDFGGKGGTFKTVPTLAAFATNVDMYYQGEFFRGYFTNFTVSETASEPGHFSYNFNFVATRRSGKRQNFMPWHRDPVSFDGETVMSQPTTEAKGAWPGVERLSFLPGGSWVSGVVGREAPLNTAGSPELGPGAEDTGITDNNSAINPVDQPQNQVINRRDAINNGSS